MCHIQLSRDLKLPQDVLQAVELHLGRGCQREKGFHMDWALKESAVRQESSDRVEDLVQLDGLRWKISGEGVGT